MSLICAVTAEVLSIPGTALHDDDDDSRRSLSAPGMHTRTPVSTPTWPICPTLIEVRERIGRRNLCSIVNSSDTQADSAADDSLSDT